MIDAYSSHPHYLDHLAPVWHAIPDDLRGAVWLAPDAVAAGEALGLAPIRPASAYYGSDRLTVVLSDGDTREARGRPLVRLAHGVGQAYTRDGTAVRPRSSYAGVRAIISVGPAMTAKWQELYPAIPIYEAGAARLDAPPRLRPRGPRPVVAVSWHWPSAKVLESGSAWPDLGPQVLDELVAIRDAGRIDLLGHAHPRWHGAIDGHYTARGIPVASSFVEVLEVADVYIVDSSSTAFEFAAMVGPVALVNSPRWRRHVDHGLRFWQASGLGPNIDRPEDVAAAVDLALTDPPEVARSRAEALDLAYHRPHDGRTASERTAMILAGLAGYCAICSARSCSCTSPSYDPATTLGDPMPSTDGPIRTYRTYAGDYRLKPASAIRRGYAPAPNSDRLPRQVVRRLRRIGVAGPDVAAAEEAYAALDDDGKAEALASFWLLPDRYLRSVLAGQAGDTIPRQAEATGTARTATEVEVDDGLTAALRGRVADVVMWVEDGHPDDIADRARRAHDAEAARPSPRTSLLERLSRLAEADPTEA